MSTIEPQDDQAPVSLHIDRVVIDGLPLTARQAAQLRGALETELARLIGEARGRGWSGSAQPFVLAPPMQAGATVRAEELGRDIARSVFATLGPQTP